MNERRVEEAASYGDVALQPVLRIENSDVKLLHRQVLEALRKYLVHIARPPHGRSFLPFFHRHAPTKLERGMNTNRTSLSHAANARKSCDGLRREQPQRPSAARENVLPYSESRPALGAATQ